MEGEVVFVANKGVLGMFANPLPVIASLDEREKSSAEIKMSKNKS